MAHIFISHSQRDEDIKGLFLRAFRGSGVNDIYQEYERAPITSAIVETIERNIETSSALFVLLSETVEALDYTKEWMLYECGVAKGKPIWVFEPYESFGRITVTIPRFDHYVRFRHNEVWRAYINSIISSYNERLLGKALITGLGYLMGGGWGAAIGLLAGLKLFQTSERPTGYPTACPGCSRQFVVHLPYVRDQFRCPGCRYTQLSLPPAFYPVVNSF